MIINSNEKMALAKLDDYRYIITHMKKDIVQNELIIGDLRDNAGKKPFKRSECNAI